MKTTSELVESQQKYKCEKGAKFGYKGRTVLSPSSIEGL